MQDKTKNILSAIKPEKYHFFGLLTAHLFLEVFLHLGGQLHLRKKIPFQSSRLFHDSYVEASLGPCWLAINSAAAQTVLL